MDAKTVRKCFLIATEALSSQAEEINKLNVFPVPDGDTGTNMSLTLQTVCKEIEKLPENAGGKEVAEAITHGSLMGARGNSGVITSQILRGIAEGVVEAKHRPITTQDLAHAMRHAKKVAFQAVRKPVEGTILTVVSDLSAACDACAKKKLSFTETLTKLIAAAFDSVIRTPELLEVLKENGVVDSGAFGFALFLEAFINAYTGQATTKTIQTSISQDAVSNHVHIEVNEDWEGSEYRYCTEFLFKLENREFDEKDALKYLASEGDCELLVGQAPHYKVHVHTNEPNKVLAYMLDYGQIFEVFIHNMDLEAQERTASIAEDKNASLAPKERRLFGFVAVAAGEGEASLLESLGVDEVIQGGQSMNPSTAEIVSAIERVNADHVIVLPNNSNVRMTAEAAAGACSAERVAVVPTKTVPQAFAALFVAAQDVTLADNVAQMSDAAKLVRTGEVTHAVRDSVAADGTAISAGDIIGIADDVIEVVGNDVSDVCCDLVDRMQTAEEGDTLTVLAGADFSDKETEALVARLEDAQPDMDIESHRGEQPLYPVIFSIE